MQGRPPPHHHTHTHHAARCPNHAPEHTACGTAAAPSRARWLQQHARCCPSRVPPIACAIAMCNRHTPAGDGPREPDGHGAGLQRPAADRQGPARRPPHVRGVCMACPCMWLTRMHMPHMPPPSYPDTPVHACMPSSGARPWWAWHVAPCMHACRALRRVARARRLRRA